MAGAKLRTSPLRKLYETVLKQYLNFIFLQLQSLHVSDKWIPRYTRNKAHNKKHYF